MVGLSDREKIGSEWSLDRSYIHLYYAGSKDSRTTIFRAGYFYGALAHGFVWVEVFN